MSDTQAVAFCCDSPSKLAQLGWVWACFYKKDSFSEGVLISTLGKKVRVEESSNYTLSGFIDGGCIS